MKSVAAMAAIIGGCTMAPEPIAPLDAARGGWVSGNYQYTYRLFTPDGVQPGRRYPLVVNLHGAGGSQNGAEYLAGIGQQAGPFFVLSPDAGNAGWQDARLTALIGQIASNPAIDPDKISAIGQSMGAFAVCQLAANHDLFSAISPAAGAIWPVGKQENAQDQARIRELAAAIGPLPFWSFHGARDNLVPVWSARYLAEQMELQGGEVEYTELASGSHNLWGGQNRLIYETPELARWLISQRRGNPNPPPPPPDPPPSGVVYYLLNKVDGNVVSDAQLRDPRVTGQSIRFSWRQANPSDGQYNWQYVDSQIARTKAAGKKFMLRPMAGVFRPGWVRGEVWSTGYLDSWVKFVEAFGRKYSGDESLFMVHLSGPVNESAEMHLTGNPTPQIISAVNAAWLRSINAYAAAFPSKYCCLNASNVFNNRDGLLESVSQSAFQILGGNASIQNNSIHAASSPSFKPWVIIRGYNGMKGGQQARAEGQAVRQTITLGKSWGLKYFEVYQPDAHFLP